MVSNSSNCFNKLNLGRLGYSLPERVGMNSDSLVMIDSLMAEMVKLNASPGGQVLIAKDNKIVFQKSYGKLSPTGYYVDNQTIYDIARESLFIPTLSGKE